MNMKNLQKGFVMPLLMIAIIAFLSIGVGTYIYLNSGIKKSENKSYSIADILKNDVLEYASASKDIIAPYKTEGYLISKTISVIYPCSTPEVCDPPIPSNIKIGFSENTTSALTVYILDVDSEKKAKELEEDLQVGHYYEFILEPGQNGPILTDFNNIKDSKNLTPDIPKTIEDALKQNGGTYMNINSSANPSDIAYTIEDSGLTNSDSSNNTLTLQPGIRISDNLPDRFATKSYFIKPKISGKASISARLFSQPLSMTLFDNDGRIIATDREVNTQNSYDIIAELTSGKTYVVEVFIETDQMENFDPNALYQTPYSIGYEYVI